GPRAGGAGGAQGQGQAAQQRFQRLDVQQEATAAPETDAVPQEALLLPPGFSGSDVAGDAIAVNGATARVDNGLLKDRARGDFKLPPGRENIAGGFGQAGVGADGGAPGAPGGFQFPGGGPGGQGAGGRGGAGGGPRGGGPGGPGGPGGRGFGALGGR